MMVVRGWSLVRRFARYGGLLVSAVACQTPVVAEPFVPSAERSGTFVLSTFRSSPVPFGYGTSTPFSGGNTLIGDTLTLSPDGAVRRAFVLRFRPGLGGCTEVVRDNCPTTVTRQESSAGTWGVRGYVVSLRDPLEPDGTIEARFSLAGDTLIVARAANGAVASGDWRYIRR